MYPLEDKKYKVENLKHCYEICLLEDEHTIAMQRKGIELCNALLEKGITEITINAIKQLKFTAESACIDEETTEMEIEEDIVYILEANEGK